MPKLHGQLIALTRNVHLTEPEREPSYLCQFFPGRSNSFNQPTGIAISWWRTNAYEKTADNIASLITTSVEGYSNYDPETVTKTLDNTLKEVCADKELFNMDAVFFSRHGTLFDARAITDVIDFADAILIALLERLKLQFAERSTVYAVPRLSGPTFRIPQLGVTFLNRDDTGAWELLCSKGYITDDWIPSTGAFRRGSSSSFDKLKYRYVLICEDAGTLDGTRFNAALRLRMALAVLLSVLSARRAYPLLRSAAEPYRQCMQFSKPNGGTTTISFSRLGALIPYYAEDLPLTDEDICRVQEWFTAAHSLPRDCLSRLEKGAHFANRAANSDDIESYVSFFVSLDALFGERGTVEASIVAAVTDLDLSHRMDEKISWLFDLRNELVHGGSRFVKEWPKHLRYYQHFNSRPHADIERLVFQALLRAPKLFASRSSGTRRPRGPLPNQLLTQVGTFGQALGRWIVGYFGRLHRLLWPNN